MEAAAYASMRESQENHWWFVGRRKVIAALIDRVARPPANAEVLEAGCGFGGNLPLLKRWGRLSAFEYDEDARAFAARIAGVPVEYGALPQKVGFADKKFDLIAMLDVLEHVEDDLGALAVLRDRLSAGGSMLITVPAFPSLWSKHDEVHHHKRRYTRRELEEKIAKAGLVTRKIGYFNSLLFALALVDRLFSKFGREQTDGAVPRPVNAMFAAIFGLESKFVGRVGFPFGLSLYAVVEAARARK